MQPVHSLLALLIVWLAMDATVAGTNRPTFEVRQRLRSEGFAEVTVDLLKSLSVPHNSVGAITNELKNPPVLDVLTRGLSIEPSRLAAFEALGFEDAQWPNNAISAEIWWRLPEATSSEVNVIQGRLKRYVDCRWEGHTAKAEIFRQVQVEVEAWMKANNIQGLGRAHRFWGEQKRILKERHGIDWRSPSDLSPFSYMD